jgi:hypothetical protein
VFVKGFLPLCCERPQVLRGNELGVVVNVLRVYQVNSLNTEPPGYDRVQEPCHFLSLRNDF